MADLVRITCPHCARAIQVPDTPGAAFVCPLCQQQFTYGGVQSAAPSQPSQTPSYMSGPHGVASSPPPPQDPFSGAYTAPSRAPTTADRITANMGAYLRQTRPWVILVAVLMFIYCGIIVILGLVGMVGLAGRGGPGSCTGLLFVLISLLYLIPGIYLIGYANAIGSFLRSGSAGDMESALKAQKSFWKFVGILIIIGLALAILGFMIGGAAMMSMGRTHPRYTY